MSEQVRIKRTTSGDILDVTYFKDGKESVPPKKFTLNIDGHQIFYVFLDEKDKWVRVSAHGNKHRIEYVNRFFTRDFFKVRELIK